MQKLFTRMSINKIASFYPFVLSIIIAVFSILVGISLGSVTIPFSTVIDVFLGQFGIMQKPVDDTVINIIMEIRFPRVLLAFIVGGALAAAGAAFQGLLRNPLADPYTLGVSSGASLGAVIVLFFNITIPFFGILTLPFVSVTTACLTLLAVISFTKMVEKNLAVHTIILTGIIFSSFLGALISLIIALSGEELRQIINWLLGSVSMRGWDFVKMILPFYAAGLLLLLINARELNAFAFGEEAAKHMGINVNRRKMIILIAASLLTGASVAVSGTIGFVGLVIPHITRLIWGPKHERLLPLAILNGGSFLVITDLLARTIIEPKELPVGVITSVIGAPIFALIFYSRSKRK
ncbi:FecCD family ABC transporter permease [Metabacillus fastidiosus]|uniref:FecCD family ABC transporter permease n=1 Tax=Metabacillus fastidiosus TaxID=1458 RepID=UPI00399C8D07